MLGKVTATTVATQTIEGANGVRYAYRRFGNGGDVPLVLFQHFTGTLDFWDPALLDALAAEREVIIFNNTGVGSTSGTTPSTVQQMARDALTFIDALKLRKIDVLGFSLGGFIAQDIALARPRLVRRLVLAGTAPQGGPGLHGWRQDIYDATHTDNPGAGTLLYIMFKQTPTSQAKGNEYLGRFMERKDRDAPGTLATRDAQYDAVVEWGIPDHNKLERLAAITQPTFVANGDADYMCPTRLTHLMGGLIPNARVKIYPDAGHGFLWQHHGEFAADVNAFLAN
ncbi:alpha/beta hydrolase [Hyphomicrobium sp.]|uniref:alpha/beta fold hydrolase n=1 Tax=Hyphomicrobium sp. TaxID=82 RepID=UPI001E1083A5|nr:alpha/beta hydrolase [Hyphomicrobium sp.]MBY0561896.1 alpha/beta hydrolase [Hyphomicrobium sp.]